MMMQATVKLEPGKAINIGYGVMVNVKIGKINNWKYFKFDKLNEVKNWIHLLVTC